MYNKADFALFEEKLLDLQEQVLGVTDLVKDVTKTVELDQNRVGRLSRMDAMQGQAMAQALADRQLVQLAKIESALKRIDQGEYGRCLICDETILAARLEIDLTAEHCISCAEAAES